MVRASARFSSKNPIIRTYSKDHQLIDLRREQIAMRSARLLVKKGYDRSTIREIASACGMTMGMLYHYVGSKEDVLYLVMNHAMSQLAEFCEKTFAGLANHPPIQALQMAIKEYFGKIDKQQDLVLFTYQETKNVRSELQRSILETNMRVVAGFEGLLARGCATGDFKIRNLTIVAHEVVALGQLWALNRWFLRKHCTLDEYTTEHIQSILRGIA